IDAAQGVEAQTIQNAYLAADNGLEILPIINKIDLPAADVPGAIEELEEVIGIPGDLAVPVSAKTGENVKAVLEAITKHLPGPSGDEAGPLRALIFAAVYDASQGVIAFIRVFDGSIKAKDRVLIASTGKVFEVDNVGIFSPQPAVSERLGV